MKIRAWLAAGAAAVFSTGCGDGLNLVPVRGVVTLNSKPLEGGQVLFMPDASNAGGQPGSDLTGPEGNYMARTNGRMGLIPGKYRVVITKSLFDKTKIPEWFKDDPSMAELSFYGPAGPKKGVDTIEGEFTADVTADGGTFDFDVKAKATAAKKASKG